MNALASDRSLRRRARLLASALAAVSAGGCLSPRQAAEDADVTAYAIIEDKQRAALGERTPFSIESAEDQLRRRLMIGQELPGAAEASFGRDFLKPVPKQPEGVTAGAMLPATANVVRGRSPRLRA